MTAGLIPVYLSSMSLSMSAITSKLPGTKVSGAALTLSIVLSLALPGQAAPAKGAPKARKRPPLEIPNVPKSQQICFALYTVQNGILKLTAQLYPLAPEDPREVRLEVLKNGQWKEISKAKVRENSYENAQYTPDGKSEQAWNAHFRVEHWDHTRDWSYRIRHGADAVYEGLIRRDPVDKKEIVVAAFTGNGNSDRRVREDIIRNIKAQDPDLLFFSGDQSYDEKRHMAAWLLFGRQFGPILKDRPVICEPDDHDVGQGNLWGAGGKKASTSAGDDGGYFMLADYVKEVEFAQTSHLPDPVDPRPIQQGIGVYFTAMQVGQVSFAIIEDRKFKTGPKGLVPQQGPRPDWITDASVDPKSVDVPGAELLGERQLKFLREWGQNWKGVRMKAVLSQTIFNYATSLSAGNRLLADLDSNGWPQTGRNKALAEMRRAFALHICGDQHLGSVVHYGIDEWDDANYAYCVPSIVNYYPRAWDPLQPPNRKGPSKQEKCGQYVDGLGNKMTMLAYNNPDPSRANRYGGEWGAKAEGYGLIRFNLETRKITLECWPRGIDVTSPKAEQYTGWPITIDQSDNYGRAAKAWLPEIRVAGMADPVVQVIKEQNGEIVYTLRIKGNSFRPKVFSPGSYTVNVGEPGTEKLTVFKNVQSAESPSKQVLQATF